MCTWDFIVNFFYSATKGYPNSGSGVGYYNPVKIDLGGVVIGALLGIGAVLVLPKLANVLSGSYGGYGNYRSNNFFFQTLLL